jgi:hypothetical protein
VNAQSDVIWIEHPLDSGELAGFLCFGLQTSEWVEIERLVSYSPLLLEEKIYTATDECRISFPIDIIIINLFFSQFSLLLFFFKAIPWRSPL